MSDIVTHFDITITTNTGAVFGVCVPTDMELVEFAKRIKSYNAALVNVDMGSSRHRTLLMELMALEKDALFRLAAFYAVADVDVYLVRTIAMVRK